MTIGGEEKDGTEEGIFVAVGRVGVHTGLGIEGRQCHRLPICFLTSDLRNQKQEQEL